MLYQNSFQSRLIINRYPNHCFWSTITIPFISPVAILYGDFPYEALGLYEAVYEINLDYLMSLNGHGDVFGIWWDRRNADLRFVLNSWQYDKYVALNHFYRPVAWKAGGWTFAVYAHYDRDRFYHAHPTVFVSYKGGHNNATWRNTGNARPNMNSRANGHSNGNRHIAQKTTVSTDRPNNGSRNSHFGGRR